MRAEFNSAGCAHKSLNGSNSARLSSGITSLPGLPYLLCGVAQSRYREISAYCLTRGCRASFTTTKKRNNDPTALTLARPKESPVFKMKQKKRALKAPSCKTATSHAHTPSHTHLTYGCTESALVKQLRIFLEFPKPKK